MNNRQLTPDELALIAEIQAAGKDIEGAIKQLEEGFAAVIGRGAMLAKLVDTVEAHVRESAGTLAAVDADQQVRWIKAARENFAAGVTQLRRAVLEPAIKGAGE